MQDSQIVLNKSKTYLLHYFVKFFNLSHLDLLKNTYVYYEGQDKVCFLYKYSGKKVFGDFERSLETSKYYHKTIDVSTDKVLYVMDVPKELTEIIDTFIKGQYSKLPEKEELISFLKLNFGANEGSKIIRIIRKDYALKIEIEESLGQSIGDLDLSSAPYFDSENFTTQKYEKEPEHDDLWKTNNLQDEIDEERDSESS